jgi:hypothetical protein
MCLEKVRIVMDNFGLVVINFQASYIRKMWGLGLAEAPNLLLEELPYATNRVTYGINIRQVLE